MKRKILAIIPARGGSKRLPGKNKLFLSGKPLIGWTIEAALYSKYITHIHLSTDDFDIIEIARKYGLTQTRLRPKELSTDSATTIDVVKYVYELEGDYEAIVILQPTSPLRETWHIDEAIELYFKKRASSVISITQCEHNLNWSNYLDEDLNLYGFIKPLSVTENDKKAYRLNGAIYVFDSKLLNAEHVNLYNEDSYGYVMDRVSSVDIDYRDDFDYAEFLMNKKKIATNESH